MLCWNVTSKKPERWQQIQGPLMLWSALRDMTLKADILITPRFLPPDEESVATVNLRDSTLCFTDHSLTLVATTVMIVPPHVQYNL